GPVTGRLLAVAVILALLLAVVAGWTCFHLIRRHGIGPLLWRWFSGHAPAGGPPDRPGHRSRRSGRPGAVENRPRGPGVPVPLPVGAAPSPSPHPRPR